MTIREDLLKLDQCLQSHMDAMQQARIDIKKTLSLIDQMAVPSAAAMRTAQPIKIASPAAKGNNWEQIKGLLASQGKPMHASEITKALRISRTAVAHHIHRHRKELRMVGSGTASKWTLTK